MSFLIKKLLFASIFNSCLFILLFIGIQNSSNKSKIDLIFNERQLELGFEGHILHDKKRFGKSILGLPSNSPKLVLPIPQSEMDSNSLMTQNPVY